MTYDELGAIALMGVALYVATCHPRRRRLAKSLAFLSLATMLAVIALSIITNLPPG